MRKKRVWRYYCDYCKKSACRSLEDHEAHCTMNPNRDCRMCKQAKLIHLPIEKLKEALSNGLDRLRQVAGNCPACILAAIRQSGKSAYGDYDFQYGEECKRFWEELNAKQEKEYANAVLYG